MTPFVRSQTFLPAAFQSTRDAANVGIVGLP